MTCTHCGHSEHSHMADGCEAYIHATGEEEPYVRCQCIEFLGCA